MQKDKLTVLFMKSKNDVLFIQYSTKLYDK